ncbi:hypothetical protein [Kitasatospora sp. LaBMicrA B282]
MTRVLSAVFAVTALLALSLTALSSQPNSFEWGSRPISPVPHVAAATI